MKPGCESAADMSGEKTQELPPRSRLYCLEPIGLRSGEVESATSYLARLAIAHTVSTLKADDFKLWACAFASPPKTDLEKMRRLLEEAAKGGMFPKSSLSKLATQLGCNQSTLQRRFPELTAIIKQRYQKFDAIRIEVRAKLFRSIVNSTIMDIHKAGTYPSQSRLRESLPKFVDMREPVAQAEWKQTLAKLHYTTA